MSVTVAIGVASAVLPFLLWRDGAGADLIYFGSATRLQDLMLGALGAQLWSCGITDRVPPRLRTALIATATASLLTMCLAVANVPFKYLGAASLAALSTTVLVIAYTNGEGVGLGERILGSRVLTWLGRRSYSIYLWHYALLSWVNPLPPLVGVPLALALTLLVGGLSWSLLEATTRLRGAAAVGGRT